MHKISNQKGQTYLQVILYLSIFLLIATLATTFFLGAQKNRRDQERIQNISQIQKALDLYYDTYNKWPQGINDGKGWDEGMHTPQDIGFIKPLVDKGFLAIPLGDPKFYGDKAMKYVVYEAGYAGCPENKGNFYVLGITELESDTRPSEKFTGSGFKCKKRNWQNEFDYVVGKYER